MSEMGIRGPIVRSCDDETLVVRPGPELVMDDVVSVSESVLSGGGAGPPEYMVVVKADVRITVVGALETMKGALFLNGSMVVVYGKNSE